jgi:hypothetical protein
MNLIILSLNDYEADRIIKNLEGKLIEVINNSSTILDIAIKTPLTIPQIKEVMTKWEHFGILTEKGRLEI